MPEQIVPRNFSQTFEQLCNFAAVSKTGRAEDIVQGLILLCFSLNEDKYVSAVQFADTIDMLLGISVPERDIAAALLGLEKGGKITTSASGEYRPDVGAQADLLKQAEEARQLEQRVKDEWQKEISARYTGMPLDGSWAALQGYLRRAFRRHGMQSVALLQPPATLSAEYQESLQSLLADAISSSLEGKFHHAAREAISSFVASAGQDADRAAYLVQLADVAFNFYKLEVPPEATRELVRRLPDLTLFLDTNFVFGLLGLHNNPQVEVSMELVDAVKKHKLPFRLRYHEKTQREIRETASFYGAILRSHYWPSSISIAAVASRRLSGIETKFHELNARGHVDVNEFLRPIEHFDVVVAAHDIMLYRQARDRTRECADLYPVYAAFLESHGKKDKPYEVIQHDVVLLDTVAQVRSKVPSTLDAGALILTCDFYLYLFDQLEARREGRLTCVVLPNMLWQILRPYLKSDTDFDKAFAATFALPEFSAIGSGASKACSKMLGILAAYGDVPEETATKLLTNGVLIDKLRHAPNDRAFAVLVERSVLEQNKELMEETAALARQVQKEEEARKKQEASHLEALMKEEKQKGDLRQQVSTMETAVGELHEEVSLQRKALDKTAEDMAEAREQATIAQRQKEDEAEARRAAESRAQTLERKATVLSGLLGFVLAAIVVGALEAYIHLAGVQLSQWVLGHSHSLGLQLSFGLVIIFGIMGLFLRRYWKWLWGTGVLAIVAVMIQII